MVKLDPGLASGFCCKPLEGGGGYTWTLTTQLGALLREAEERFGARDMSWTILGIEFFGSHPSIWYPGDCRHIAVMLSESATRDSRRALYQLAHEVIHVLAPTGGAHSPVIEEGLAAHFATEISARYGHGLIPAIPAYIEAANAVRSLLALDANAILAIRAKEPAFAKMTPDLIRAAVDGVDDNLSRTLCQPFSSFRNWLGNSLKSKVARQ